MNNQSERFTQGSGVRVSDYHGEQEVTVLSVVLALVGAIPYMRVLAVIIWGLGLLCTVQTAKLFFSSADLQIAAAIITQAGLTALQSPIWRRWAWDGKEEYKRPFGFWNVIALIVDAALNIVGTSIVVERIHELPFVPAIVRLLSGEESGPVEPLVGLPALALATLFAGLLSAAPERLWWWE